MATPLTLTPSRGPDGAALLKAVGEIDISNTAVLTDALATIPGRLVVDLTEVDYLDSAGLNVLFTHAERIEVVVGAVLAPVVSISGLGEVAKVREAEK
jgi:anti-anti-sigma factor